MRRRAPLRSTSPPPSSELNRPGRSLRPLGRTAAGALAVCLAMATVPPLRAGVKAATTLIAAVGGTVPRPLAVPVERRPVAVGGVSGDLYDPGWAAPAVVVVPGATRAGRDDVRAVRAAIALAQTGRTVFVPELSLYGRRLDADDLERLRVAVRGLADRTGRPAGIVGFSFGGSYALLAAAELPGRVLSHVAVFGAYYDLVGMLQAATTGATVLDGRVVRWDGDPSAQRIVTDVVLRELAEEPTARRVAAALDAGSGDELDGDAAVLHELLTNDDPHRTAALVEALPAARRDLVRRFSPASVAGGLHVPVAALHARDDPAVPYTEGVRLARGLPGVRFVGVELFHHVDFTAPGIGALARAAPDLAHTLRYGRWLLAPQEPWVPATLRRRRR